MFQVFAEGDMIYEWRCGQSDLSSNHCKDPHDRLRSKTLLQLRMRGAVMSFSRRTLNPRATTQFWGRLTRATLTVCKRDSVSGICTLVYGDALETATNFGYLTLSQWPPLRIFSDLEDTSSSASLIPYWLSMHSCRNKLFRKTDVALLIAITWRGLNHAH